MPIASLSVAKKAGAGTGNVGDVRRRRGEERPFNRITKTILSLENPFEGKRGEKKHKKERWSGGGRKSVKEGRLCTRAASLERIYSQGATRRERKRIYRGQKGANKKRKFDK